MTNPDVEILEKTTVYDGYFRIDRYRLRHRLHAGGWTAPLEREVFERGHAVAVLPYDPVRDEIVLLEQFRIGAHAAGRQPWLVEIVAGIIEDGETVEDVARRECLEEAGCAIEELEPLYDYLVSPGGTSESVSLFIGHVDAANAGGIYGLAEEDEDIRAFCVPTDEALNMLAQGGIGNAVALIALQWLALNKDNLRKKWGITL